MRDTVYFDCSNCWVEWTITPTHARDKFEVVTVHTEDGREESLACFRCGSLVEPSLSEVE